MAFNFELCSASAKTKSTQTLLVLLRRFNNAKHCKLPIHVTAVQYRQLHALAIDSLRKEQSREKIELTFMGRPIIEFGDQHGI